MAEYATLAGVIVAVVTFVYDKYANFKIRKEDIERTWYANVLIQPNLAKIEICFDELYVQYKSSIVSLSSNIIAGGKFTRINVEPYRNLKSNESDKISARLQKLELGIIEPIRRYHTSLHEPLTSLLMEVENHLLYAIEAEEFADKDVTNVENFLFNKKADLLDLLYEPIRRPKPAQA